MHGALFVGLLDVPRRLEAMETGYDRNRPHSSIGNLTHDRVPHPDQGGNTDSR